MDERRVISSARHTPTDVARVNFGVVRKGFDPVEVRSYLDNVARELQFLESRIQELQHQLSDALHRAANPVLDEATLAAALGSQSAAILRTAHEEAGRVTAEAQQRAAAVFSQAQERATGSLVEAQERAAAIVSDAEASATRVEEESRAGAQRLVDSARVNGEALVERAREQGRAIVRQSHDARKSVLNDLAVKRKALHVQIDQLRAARDSLQESITSVRESVEGVLTGLMSSDEGARTAAIEALRNRPVAEEAAAEDIPEPEPPEFLEEVALEAPTSAAGTEAPEGSGADVVEEIFARLRKATLEERGAKPPAPRKAPPAPVASTEGELFTRRDQAVEGSLAVLTRKVKRALQDDQNVMIEALRGVTGLITTELEDEFTQRARYRAAAESALRDAVDAGAKFAVGENAAASAGAESAVAEECAGDLAVTIVVALRRRILADGHDDGAERVNAAYKEWRGARVERLCTDAARRAFNAGVVAASAGGAVRFVVTPSDAPCDACRLDAEAGTRVSGSAFPSGQTHPPLHAGCACAITPA